MTDFAICGLLSLRFLQTSHNGSKCSVHLLPHENTELPSAGAENNDPDNCLITPSTGQCHFYSDAVWFLDK